LERSRGRIENEQDLHAQAAAVSGAKAAIGSSELRIAQLDSAYRRELSNERIEVLAQIDRLREDLGKQTHRGAQLELRAPSAGVIKDLATRTPGTVVAPGTILATIVPRGEPLEAEVWIENRDIGHVQTGARVALKLGAYPYQRHGTVAGTVRHLSADATDRPDATAAGGGAASLHYRALIVLEPDTPRLGTPLRLVAGMQLAAEMHVGTRTVFEYLVSPLQSAWSAAGREP
jgi:HlyD family secretion protein